LLWQAHTIIGAEIPARAIQNPGKIRACHAEAVGRFLHCHVAQVILKDFAGMGGMEKQEKLIQLIQCRCDRLALAELRSAWMGETPVTTRSCS